MADILQNPVWVIVLICAITVLVVLIVELNYRLFTKRMLDMIFSGLLIVICSPVLLVLAVLSKKREGKVFGQTPYLGQRGKIIYLSTFLCTDGNIKFLARLFDIFLGKLSFVGVKLMDINDGALISDEDMDRFTAKPGLILNLAAHGNETLSYETAFDLDRKYAKRCELFGDIWIIIKSLIYVLRGEHGAYLGELAEGTYGETLLARGTITKEQLSQAKELAESELPHSKTL